MRHDRLALRQNRRVRVVAPACAVALLITGLGFIEAPPAAAIECIENCIADPPPPAAPSSECGAACIPAGRPTITITGVVQTVRGVPLANAAVYWTYGSVVTNSNGAYSLLVWSDGPVTLIANHSLAAWKSTTVPDPGAIGAQVQNFSLYYLLNVTVSPDAFKTTQFETQTLTYSVYSTAPTGGSRALVRRSDGTHFQLQRDLTYVDPEGWSRWTATRDVYVGTPEGRYTFRGCVVEEFVSGHCEPDTPNLLSQVKTEAYAVDYTPPSISAANPAAFGAIPHGSSPTIHWTDLAAGSGFGSNPQDFSITVDGGSTQVETFIGNAPRTQVQVTVTSSVAPGIHSATFTAVDRAGNSAIKTWPFTVVEVVADPATATLQEQVAPVNPAETTVTFATPTVATTTFRETIKQGPGSATALHLARSRLETPL